MRVKDLIEALKAKDPEAVVVLKEEYVYGEGGQYTESEYFPVAKDGVVDVIWWREHDIASVEDYKKHPDWFDDTAVPAVYLCI